jgi:type IX secretion system PorP/SprF family membrane protein
MKRRGVFFILLFIVAGNAMVHAQQLPFYSQYVMNEFMVNPAVAGVDGLTSINLTGRKQWVGFTNPPQTYSASISSRILKKGFIIKRGSLGSSYRKSTKGRVGLGAAFISDKNGAISRTGLQVSYAYHIFLLNSQLSMGLTGSTMQLKIDEEAASFRSPSSDPLTPLIGKSTYIPDVNVGANLATPNFHVGVSVMNLFQTPWKIGETSLAQDQLQHTRQYNLLWTYRTLLPGNTNWEAEPSILGRTNERLDINGDVSCRMIYKREYWAGLSVRTSGDFVLLLGLRYDRLYFGYSFDYGFNAISRLSRGSHEISFALKLGDSTRRYRWLERY